MRRAAVTPVADAVAALTLALLVAAGVVLTVAAPATLVQDVLADAAFVLGFGLVGWQLGRRLPANPIGWCFSLAAFSGAVSALAHGWATLALTRTSDPSLLTRVSALVDTYSWTVGVPLALLLPSLLLPDGRLPSRRWRPAFVTVLCGCAVGAIGYLSTPGAIDPADYRLLDNPLGVSALDAVRPAMGLVTQITYLASVVAGFTALVRRFRGSHGVQRQQLRWVALGGCCVVVGQVLGSASGSVLPEGVRAAADLGFFALPVCVGVAVLRHRLYDLGRLVSRTVSYAVLSAILLGVYLLMVTTLVRLLPDSSSLAVAASTLAVAALFQPLRRRVQTLVDRRFNRARYDADHTVEVFTRRLREEVDLDEVRADLLHVVHDTMQPTTLGLWLRDAAR